MKTAQLKSIILAILIVSLSLFSYAQPNSVVQRSVQGIELSKEIYSYFTEKGFSVEQQDLLPSASTSFPQNLIITLSAKDSLNSNKIWNDSSVETIIFDIPQEFAYDNLENLSNFIKKMDEANLTYSSVFLLSANDNIPALPGMRDDSNLHPNGTKIYTTELGYDDKCAAIIISRKWNSIPSLIPGSNKNIAPLWLVRTIYEKMAESKTNQPSLPPFFSLLYSLNLSQSIPRVDSFMDMGIPAAGIRMATEEDDYETLFSIATELSSLHKENWDRNYLFFTLGGKHFWIPEAATIAISVLVILTVLFVVCFTGIFPSYKSKALLNDIRRSWFIYPIVVALTTLLLHAAQSIFSFYANTNPLMLIGLKIFVSFIIIFPLFIVQTSLNIFISIRAYGFLMVASSILNIFVFTGSNLLLMYFFVAEFLLMLVAEKVKSTPSLIVTLILILTPFLQLLWALTKNTMSYKVAGFVNFSWTQDMFFAMMLFPVLIQLERIFISTDLLSPNKKLKIKNYIITSICAEAALSLVLWVLYGQTSMLIKSSTNSRITPINIQIKDKDFPSLSATISEQEFMELSMRTLTVKSPENVMRYEISIETENGVPIFESNYNYILEANNKISFVIPDFPSDALEIVYSADATQKSKVTVQAYIIVPGDWGNIYKETVTVDTKSLQPGQGTALYE